MAAAAHSSGLTVVWLEGSPASTASQASGLASMMLKAVSEKTSRPSKEPSAVSEQRCNKAP
eukprot:10603474-Lingulodinium_polyedra.AAC.1